MTIGVVFEGNLQDGGGYQQQLSTVETLQGLGTHRYIAFVFSKINKVLLERRGLQVCLVQDHIVDRVVRFFSRQEIFYSLFAKFKIISTFEFRLLRNSVDLVYFLAPSWRASDLLLHNYVFTVWDLSHRDTPEFPEVRKYRDFEKRDLLYSRSLPKAVAVIVDSDIGKSNLTRRYLVDSSRVYSVSFLPSMNSRDTGYIDIKTKYKIFGDYIYYPAQFWAHKNHIYILEALSILKSEGLGIVAVFSGSDKGNMDYIRRQADTLGIRDQVMFVGFVPMEDIYYLYKNALAMVMPSFFGPTNLPPLEAFAIGTPVVYSDIPGLRDQVGNAALLCDLTNPRSLASHIRDLNESTELRASLVRRGAARLEELLKTSLAKVLQDIFSEFAIKLKSWKG